jgi:type IV pilus biogenesis/stability protein PilW
MRPAALAALSLLPLLAACAHGASVKDQKTAEIHHDLAAEAVRAGRPQDAMGEYDKALAADPDLAEAHHGRGLVLDLAFGRSRDAEAEYRRALELKPAYSEAHNSLGQLLAKAGRYEEALKEFDAALESTFYREPWVAHTNKGLTLHRMGRRDEGYAELRSALTFAPRYCFARRELGRLLLGEGKVKDSLVELERYATDCAAAADAHYQLGLGRMKAGDLPGAREQFERCETQAGAEPPADECRKSRLLLE